MNLLSMTVDEFFNVSFEKEQKDICFYPIITLLENNIIKLKKNQVVFLQKKQNTTYRFFIASFTHFKGVLNLTGIKYGRFERRSESLSQNLRKIMKKFIKSQKNA